MPGGICAERVIVKVGVYLFYQQCNHLFVISKGYIPSPFDNFVFKKNKKFPHASKIVLFDEFVLQIVCKPFGSIQDQFHIL